MRRAAQRILPLRLRQLPVGQDQGPGTDHHGLHRERVQALHRRALPHPAGAGIHLHRRFLHGRAHDRLRPHGLQPLLLSGRGPVSLAGVLPPRPRGPHRRRPHRQDRPLHGLRLPGDAPHQDQAALRRHVRPAHRKGRAPDQPGGARRQPLRGELGAAGPRTTGISATGCARTASPCWASATAPTTTSDGS